MFAKPFLENILGKAFETCCWKTFVAWAGKTIIYDSCVLEISRLLTLLPLPHYYSNQGEPNTNSTKAGAQRAQKQKIATAMYPRAGVTHFIG